jgi:hypothetical protein
MEDVNFPLDQSQVSGALRGLREAGGESSRPRRLEDSEDEFRNPEARDDEEVEQTAQAERTVIAQDRVDVLEQDQQQEQIIAGIAEEALEVVVRGFTGSLPIQIAAVASKLTTEQQSGGAEALLNPFRADRESGVDPRGGASSPEERLTERFEEGNDVADPDRIEEVQGNTRVDSVAEGTRRANDEATSVEQENPATPLQGQPSIRDVAEDGGSAQERLDESFNSDPPSASEKSAEELDQTPPNDARIQQRIQEERVAEEESRIKNEPALETPAQNIDPVEDPEEPLQEAVDNNPLRGPRPSELRDDDASAVETERGQNVSNLI